jgi:serine/threonine-protein phosphatase 2B regulatory subunit
MGCGGSTFDLERSVPPDWVEQFEALQMNKAELNHLFFAFKSIDRDQGGSIDISELLQHLDIEETSFSKRTFSVFDSNRSGSIDLREFILSLWNYCTLTQATLDIFAFDLYDTDESGELSFQEVENMVCDLYGANINHNANARQ